MSSTDSKYEDEELDEEIEVKDTAKAPIKDPKEEIDDGSSDEASRRAEELLADLIKKTDQLFAGTLKSKPKKKNKRGRRKTEREEDEELLAEQENEVDAPDVLTRLTVQPSLITGGTLRPYQMEGLNWMIRLHHYKVSGILADEMGLGKTLQTISLLAYLKQFTGSNGPHLVIVPLSVLGNWMNEFARFCPALKVFKFHGTKEERAEMASEGTMKKQEWDVCLTSYEMAIKEKAQLRKHNWQFVVVDEAHRLKNESSSLSLTLREFHSTNRLLLTGTPLQNNLHELWALLNFLLPDLFHSSEDFDAMFAQVGAQKKVLEYLHKILHPFMLRRLKSDVEKSLLPKKEMLVFVGMSEMQQKVYRSVLLRDMEAVTGHVSQANRLLNMVMQLRKAANHPYLFDGIEDRSLPPYAEHLVTNSGKMVVLDKLLKKLQDRGSRVLIFSQMTRQLDILEDYCVFRNYKFARIDGSTGTEDRNAAVDDFNKPDSDKFLFLLSTRAGGLGLNLATADIVIIYDSDWNPQMDLQAQDRAHRIGQKKQVYVYRFVTENSVEVKIIERAEIKLRLDAMVVQQGRLAKQQQQGKKLSKEDMKEMIRYGADEVFRSKGSTITDEDIDLILSRGEQKMAEMNAKLTKHVGMMDMLALDGAVSDGRDPYAISTMSEEEKKAQELNLMHAVHDSLAQQQLQRGRRTAMPGYDVNKYYKDAMHVPTVFRNSHLIRPLKLPRMPDWQLFNKERILEISEKEQAYWEKYATSDEVAPELKGISKEEEDERTRLLAEGQVQWNRDDFFAFIRASGKYGRDEVTYIAKDMAKHGSSKTLEEVQKYHKLFWEKLPTIENHEKYVKKIERDEARLAKYGHMTATLERALAAFPTRESLETMNIIYRVQHKDKCYTPANDRYLLFETARLGYGKWEKLRKAIRKEPEFRFDYFLRSRTALELSRRVDAILRTIQKEQEKYDKKHEKQKPAPAKSSLALLAASSSSSSASSSASSKRKASSPLDDSNSDALKKART